MKTACEYAIIRFLPFPETGEFANVGIVLLCSKQNYFSYRLAPRAWGRMSRFFEGLQADIYRLARNALVDELERLQGFTAAREIGHVFTELVRPRDAVMRFSNRRIVLADDPAEKLQEVFGFYVERQFATKEYQERVLERSVRIFLSAASLASLYRPHTIGDDEFHIGLPFVRMEGDRPYKAIKPLKLDQDETSGILDHGGHWVDRVNRLKRRQLLPERLLFAVKRPDGGPRARAAREITDELRMAGATVTEIGDREEILSFAK